MEVRKYGNTEMGVGWGVVLKRRQLLAGCGLGNPHITGSLLLVDDLRWACFRYPDQ